MFEQKGKHKVFDEDADDAELDEIINKKVDNKHIANNADEDESDAPEEVNAKDDSIRRLQELHNQLKTAGDASKKRKRGAVKERKEKKERQQKETQKFQRRK